MKEGIRRLKENDGREKYLMKGERCVKEKGEREKRKKLRKVHHERRETQARRE